MLLVLIMRDQRKAIAALAAAEGSPDGTGRSESAEPATAPQAAAAGDVQPTATAAAGLKTAAVERGRIASIAGLTGLIWLVILVLMVWNG